MASSMPDRVTGNSTRSKRTAVAPSGSIRLAEPWCRHRRSRMASSTSTQMMASSMHSTQPQVSRCGHMRSMWMGLRRQPSGTARSLQDRVMASSTCLTRALGFCCGPLPVVDTSIRQRSAAVSSTPVQVMGTFTLWTSPGDLAALEQCRGPATPCGKAAFIRFGAFPTIQSFRMARCTLRIALVLSTPSGSERSKLSSVTRLAVSSWFRVQPTRARPRAMLAKSPSGAATWQCVLAPVPLMTP